MREHVNLSDQAPSADDYLTARTVAEKLHELYPGYLWAVHSRREHGMLDIRNLSLPAQYGYTLHLAKIATASELTRKAAHAAGEILERYRLARRAIDWDAYDNLPVDFRGQIVGDVAS